MNPLRKNAQTTQKYFLRLIGATLKIFASAWGMTRENFQLELSERLNIPDSTLEHYLRDGLPLPNRRTHKFKIARKQLCDALQDIFDFVIRGQIENDEKRMNALVKLNELNFSIISECYDNLEKLEACMPFLTDDFENYLISQLVYREAWPLDERPLTQEDRKLLKESLEMYSLKRIGREQQSSVSDEDIHQILSAIECINHFGRDIGSI